MIQNEKPVYLKGLNGIRAIAALLVVIGHIEIFKSSQHATMLFDLTQMTLLAKYGVDIFFVLSGFLISYLLMAEIEKTGRIRTKNFYIRRILRIWPLYFTVILISLVASHFIPIFDLTEFKSDSISLTDWKLCLLYIGMMPHIAVAVGYGVYTLNILWSVGVEEQFYLFWPFLINKFKNILYISICILLLFPILRLLSDWEASGRFSLFDKTTSPSINVIIHSLKFDLMALGAIAAYILRSQKPVYVFIKNSFRPQWIPYVSFALIVFLWLNYGFFPVFIQIDVQGVLYAIILMHICLTHRPFRLLENKIMNALGKYSYGIYIFHEIIIVVTQNTHQYMGWQTASTITTSILLSLFIILFTILIAGLSYHFFEMPFLNMKKRFMVIKSSNDATPV